MFPNTTWLSLSSKVPSREEHMFRTHAPRELSLAFGLSSREAAVLRNSVCPSSRFLGVCLSLWNFPQDPSEIRRPLVCQDPDYLSCRWSMSYSCYAVAKCTFLLKWVHITSRYRRIPSCLLHTHEQKIQR
jgi:hypothetical protein